MQLGDVLEANRGRQIYLTPIRLSRRTAKPALGMRLFRRGREGAARLGRRVAG